MFRDELMVSTDENHILRYRWDGTVNNDFCIDLRRIPFSLDQQASRAVPITVQTILNFATIFLLVICVKLCNNCPLRRNQTCIPSICNILPSLVDFLLSCPTDVQHFSRHPPKLMTPTACKVRYCFCKTL